MSKSASSLPDFRENILPDDVSKVVGLVPDNLDTYKKGSLYEAFEPTEGRRIARRLEFHYTPKHGSWLNMVAIKLSVFSKQYLRGRIADELQLRQQIGTLEAERNDAGAVIR